jgi:hypothetical protein
MLKKTGIHIYIYIKNLICNEIFLKEFLAKIFKLKWFDLIKVMLDLAYDKNNKRLETNFIYINNDYTMKNESYFEIDSIYWENLSKKSSLAKEEIIQVIVDQKNKDQIEYPNSISDFEEITGRYLLNKRSNSSVTLLSELNNNNNNNNNKSNSKETSVNNFNYNEFTQISRKQSQILKENILFLIYDSKYSSFLIHETTQELLSLKWKYLPSCIYYFNLILYFLFLVFYTCLALNISVIYYDLNLILQSQIICSILLAYFICLEFFQFWDLKYLYFVSIENLINTVHLIVCFIVLWLPDSNVKSCLCSITSLSTYAILVSRLDKFHSVGPYVKVFSKLISKSIGVIFIIIIMLVGFTLAISVRANYYKTQLITNQTNSHLNEITNFEFNFLNNIYTMYTYMAGQVVTAGMGVDYLDSSSFVMFLIYGLFCFTINILFYNIFIGIATYEIRKIIENSKIKITSSKIEYIFKLELILKGSFVYKRLENCMKWIENYYRTKIYNINYVSNVLNEYDETMNYGNKTDENDENNENETIKLTKIQNEKIDRLMIELKQMSILVQNQFNFIDKKMDKMEKKIELGNKIILSKEEKLVMEF